MIINDDILNWCKEYKGEKFHALLCDPPYHLTEPIYHSFGDSMSGRSDNQKIARKKSTKGFMGKSWDGGDIAFRKETWEALKEHLYPGAFCFAFASTRGLHRMMCAIEDAGFIIHPTIFLYAFGCLSEDTEVLTKDGWERYHNNKNNINTSYNNVLNKEILIYDYKNDNYTWEVPKRIFNYKYKDTAYRITSNKTEQIVSRGHRCLVKREGKLLFVQAEKLFNMEYMPYLRNDFFEIFKFQKEIGKRILQPKLQWESEGIKFNKIFRQREREKTTGKRFKRRKKSCLERRLYLYEKKRSVCEPIDKIRKMPYKLHINGKERRLCYGTSLNSRKRDKTAFVKNRSSASHKSQCRRQQNRKFNVIQIEYRTQKIRTRASYNTTLATVTKIDYEGIMYCPTVSTGAFVARRNGKIFITGNSGFPKATRIDTQIQSKEEQEVVGRIDKPAKAIYGTFYCSFDEPILTAPTDPIAKRWTGHRYGLQALKPSCEPIICFQKRYEGKPVNCIVETGAGALNIDGGRIAIDYKDKNRRPNGSILQETAKGGNSCFGASGRKPELNGDSLDIQKGRWPANLIIDKECAERFPMTADLRISKRGIQSKSYSAGIEWGKAVEETNTVRGHSDSSSAARYFKNVEMKIDNADPVFYTSKVSKEERNKGCEGMVEKEVKVSVHQNATCGICGRFIRADYGEKGCQCKKPIIAKQNITNSRNVHPCLKSIDLTTYLATLLLPPIEYAPRRILVPFAGAGSEMIGCLKAGWEDIVGIELTTEYIPIIEARFEYYRKQIELEKEQQLFEPEIMESIKKITKKKTLFES